MDISADLYGMNVPEITIDKDQLWLLPQSKSHEGISYYYGNNRQHVLSSPTQHGRSPSSPSLISAIDSTSRLVAVGPRIEYPILPTPSLSSGSSTRSSAPTENFVPTRKFDIFMRHAMPSSTSDHLNSRRKECPLCSKLLCDSQGLR